MGLQFGKRTGQAEYPRKGRGTQGVIALQTSDRNGALVGAIQLTEQHEILLISDQGTLVRTRTDEITVQSRNTQGVTLIRVAADEKLVGTARVKEPVYDETDGLDADIDESVADSTDTETVENRNDD